MGMALSSITIHRKPKDGTDGIDAVNFSVSPGSIIFSVNQDGTYKNPSQNVSLSLMRGNTNILSSYQPEVYNVTGGVEAEITGSVLKITAGQDTQDKGVVVVMSQIQGVVYARNVYFSKVVDGTDGENGKDGADGKPGNKGEDALTLQCNDIICTLLSNGTLKNTEGYSTTAQLIIGGNVDSGAVYDILVNDSTALSATVNAQTGLITVTSYIKEGTISVTAISSTGYTLRKDISVRAIADGTQGVAGDIMIYKGEWNSTTAYKTHYTMTGVTGKYFTDYVTLPPAEGDTMAKYYLCKVNNTNKNPASYSSYWTKFTESEAIATKLLISNQIVANLISCIQLNAQNFFTKTLFAQELDAEHAVIKNLFVNGWMRSSFVNLTFDNNVYGMYDTNNVLITNSSNPDLKYKYIRLYNNLKFIGSRVMIALQPISDEGIGKYKEGGVVYITTGYELEESTPEESTPKETAIPDTVDYFMGTKSRRSDDGDIFPAKTIALWDSGFIELVGVPAPLNNPTKTRWMVLNYYSSKQVEFLEDKR